MRSALLSVALCLALCKVRAVPKLIVILVDGVRWDYLDDPKLKSFQRMAEDGVRAHHLLPVYPSLTYPNMYSLVTGLYAENHGFLSNYLFNQDTGSFFRGISDPDSTDPSWWNEAEPIWITAEKNNMSTALYWWGGCEVRIKGRHPMICERERYGPPTPEEREDFVERIDDIVEMLKPSKRFPKDRLSLVLIYHGPTDYVGHVFGPKSAEEREALYEMDGILGKLQRKLEKAGLKEQVNIMIASDHGMTYDSNVKYIDLEQFAPDIKFQVSYGTESMIVPREGMLDKLYRDVKGANLKGIQIYKKEDIPSRYHIKESKRMTPLYLVAEKGYLIKGLKDPTKNIKRSSIMKKGNHGYDPTDVQDMRAIFLASGPDFRSSFKAEALNMTDLYNVMCKVLQIEPLPNNGSWDRVSAMLKTSSYRPSTQASRSSAAVAAHHPLCILVLSLALNAFISTSLRNIYFE